MWCMSAYLLYWKTTSHHKFSCMLKKNRVKIIINILEATQYMTVLYRLVCTKRKSTIEQYLITSKS